MVEIPPRLRLKASQNAERRSWLADLPDLCRRLSREWDLRLGKPLDGGHVSFVARARRGSSELVLKVPMPSSIDLGTLAASARAREAAALQFWAGDGAVRLLEHDHVTGALLIERCRPGSTLDLVGHLDQDRVAAALLTRLHQRHPEPGEFVRLPMVGDPSYDAVQYLLFRKGDLPDPEASWGSQIRAFCARLGVDSERTKAWLFARLVSDAVAACTEEGATAAVLERRQGDLWSARLAHRLL